MATILKLLPAYEFGSVELVKAPENGPVPVLTSVFCAPVVFIPNASVIRMGVINSDGEHARIQVADLLKSDKYNISEACARITQLEGQRRSELINGIGIFQKLMTFIAGGLTQVGEIMTHWSPTQLVKSLPEDIQTAIDAAHQLSYLQIARDQINAQSQINAFTPNHLIHLHNMLQLRLNSPI